MSFIPPRSPYGLIQEDLWPDEWKTLISCVMLNCTSRKQAEKVMRKFFDAWPTAKDLLKADPNDVEASIESLGFKVRRTKTIFSLSKVYVSGSWSHARDLPGIGEYGSRAWEIFCKNDMGTTPPKDHALTKYWHWRIKNDKKKNDGTAREDREKSPSTKEGEGRFIEAA